MLAQWLEERSQQQQLRHCAHSLTTSAAAFAFDVALAAAATAAAAPTHPPPFIPRTLLRALPITLTHRTQYNLALCCYKAKQYGQALKFLAEIIEQALREHPELGVGSQQPGVELVSARG